MKLYTTHIEYTCQEIDAYDVGQNTAKSVLEDIISIDDRDDYQVNLDYDSKKCMTLKSLDEMTTEEKLQFIEGFQSVIDTNLTTLHEKLEQSKKGGAA